MKDYYLKNSWRGIISLLLAFAMIIGGFSPFYSSEVKAAGTIIELPNVTEDSVSEIFNFYARKTTNPKTSPNETPLLTTPSLSTDGSDIVRFAWMQTYMGALVSKNKVNIINNDFELSFDISATDGSSVGDRGAAFVLHNDPKGPTAMGGASGNLGIHGYTNTFGGIFPMKPVKNALAIEIDMVRNSKHDVQTEGLDRTYDVTSNNNGKNGAHIAIVKPAAQGEDVNHQETMWVGTLLQGENNNNEPGYNPGNPPTTRTMRVKWTNQNDENYKLSYEFWFDGDQKDIPGASVVTGEKIYSREEAVEIFGGEEVYFGIYGSGDFYEKWEALFAGFINKRSYKVGYDFDKQVMNDDGTYRTTPTEVPHALMTPINGKGLNGDRDVKIAPLAAQFEKYLAPTAELTNSPYTPLKNPVLMPTGQNHTNDHSFKAVNFNDLTAKLYLVPFRSGATAAERAEVDNYILKVEPKKVDVKIEYLLVDEHGPIVADTVVQTVALGSEVGLTDKKEYVGYQLDSATDGAIFDKSKVGFVKKEVGFQLYNSLKTVAGGTATTNGDNIEEPLFQVIYTITEEAKVLLNDAVAKTKAAAEDPTTEKIEAANDAINLIPGMREEAGLRTVTAAAQKVLDYKNNATEENKTAAQAEINKVTSPENADNKKALQARLDAEAWKEKNKDVLALKVPPIEE